MTVPADPIADADLHAYVDDQLTVTRRIEVEGYLSDDPQAAARVMADLRGRDELRVALGYLPGIARSGTADVARRLARGLVRDRLLGRLRRVAAVAVVLAVGWAAHAQFGGLTIGQVVASPRPPGYVEDAVMAYRTILVRATMQSQHREPDYNREEIRAATAIAMPELPRGWKLIDVQIFPSKFGPSVEMAIRTSDLGILSLYAIRPGTFKVVPATVVDKVEATLVYWQIGEVAYALSAKPGTQDLKQAAARLTETLD